MYILELKDERIKNMKKSLLPLFILTQFIFADPPDWYDEPGTYELTMTIVSAAILEEDELITAEGDMFAAFDDDGAVRGVGTMLYTPFGSYAGEYLWEMVVRSDYVGDVISFMYYDASEETILNVVEILIFEPDAMYGNILVPMIFNIGSDCEDNDWDGICDDVDDCLGGILDACGVCAGPATSSEDCNEDGYDDASFAAGAASTDTNNDGLVDEFPIISIVDGNAQILIENPQGNYIDSGANCSDQEEGDLSHQVEVSGQVVNMNIPGTYTVSYDCSDSDGNAAQTKNRTVFVISPIIADENEDGFDDEGFLAGAQSGDITGDGILNVADLVAYINIIIN